MPHPGRTGRLFGGALLLTFAVGIYINFGLHDVLHGGDGVLANAGAMPMRIGAVGLVTLLTGVVSIAAASMLSHATREAQPWLGRTYLALVSLGLVMSLAEFATLAAYRELAEAQRAGAGGMDAATAVLRGLRDGIHFPDKLMGGAAVALMFVLLLRSRLLPAWLAWLGLAAALVQMVGVAHGVLGRAVPMQALLPMAVTYLTTSLWLLVRGFPGQTRLS